MAFEAVRSSTRRASIPEIDLAFVTGLTCERALDFRPNILALDKPIRALGDGYGPFGIVAQRICVTDCGQ